jgi:galactokinase
MTAGEGNLKERFQTIFDTGVEPLIVRSPGRVNIIGEHTDYNDGFVLPAAIDKAAYVAISGRADNIISLYANEFGQQHDTSIDALAPTEKGWPNYIMGVVDQLQKAGKQIGGFNLLVDGDIPLGAGLSSSAALECATVFALNELFSLNISKQEMAPIAQHAEHEFAGVNCGIMDMFASLFGKKDHAISLDCRSLDYEYVPLNLKGYKILLLNTNVKHQLASSAYNTRRQQCEQGVAWVKEQVPSVKALRDVTVAMLDEHVLPKDVLIYQRCRFVVDENNRLLQACEDLKKGDIHSLGQKMFETHDGLSKQYEVSCKELDFLVEQVRNNKAVLGARMMGGGFGGCTINLVEEGAIEQLAAEVKLAYDAAMGLSLTHYVASVEDGTKIISPKAPANV